MINMTTNTVRSLMTGCSNPEVSHLSAGNEYKSSKSNISEEMTDVSVHQSLRTRLIHKPKTLVLS